MNNKYQIYSGFVKDVDPNKYGGLDADDWFDIWYKNTICGPNWCNDRYTYNPVYLFGPDFLLVDAADYDIQNITAYNNLGHIGDYIHGKRQGKWCGWTAGVVFGMMHAYLHNVDFLYKEQDCLWFGQGIVDQMYQDLGDKDIVFGSCKLMGPAQSLFLVRRNAIPNIIASLAQDDDKDVLPEYKFARLPNQAKLSFGYDRDRPFNIDDVNWYIQQVSKEELDLLQSKGLV
jgi:hypothetical protein